MKNFDRIKNMTVEEMASEIDRISGYLCDRCGCKECPLNFSDKYGCEQTGFADWLNSEVKE